VARPSSKRSTTSRMRGLRRLLASRCSTTADRVTAAFLAQLVNVIAPIHDRDRGPAWTARRYSIPFAHFHSAGSGAAACCSPRSTRRPMRPLPRPHDPWTSSLPCRPCHTSSWRRYHDDKKQHPHPVRAQTAVSLIAALRLQVAGFSRLVPSSVAARRSRSQGCEHPSKIRTASHRSPSPRCAPMRAA